MASGVARSGFDVDLRFGQAREAAFTEAVTLAEVECKADQKVRQTGNFFIEIRQKRRPSGLSTTTAQWWALEYQTDCWLVIRTSILKMLVKRAKDLNGTVMGGDFDAYEGVLVPINWVLDPLREAA